MKIVSEFGIVKEIVLKHIVLVLSHLVIKLYLNNHVQQICMQGGSNSHQMYSSNRFNF